MIARFFILGVLFSCLTAPSSAQTLDWVINQLHWIKPAEPPDTLVGHRTAICFLSYWKPSTPVWEALRSFERDNAGEGTRIVVVWYQVGPDMMDSLMANGAPLTQFARDPFGEVYDATTRAKHIPYTMLIERTGQVVWEGSVDSTIYDVLSRFSDGGQLPNDPSLPIAPVGDGAFEFHVRKAEQEYRDPTLGITNDGTRVWVRSGSSARAMHAVAQFLEPLADVHSVPSESSTELFDLDLVVRKGADRHRLRDSIFHVLDSVFGTITMVNTVRYARSVLTVSDRAALSQHRSTSGRTLEQLAHRYRGRFQTRVVLDTSCDLDERYEFPIPFSTRREVDSVFRLMGLYVDGSELGVGPITNIVVRDSSIPESQVVYRLGQLHTFATIGATLQYGSDETWYGGEVGVNHGLLMNGHGFFGFAARRACIEVLTNGHRVVGGLNLGVDYSSVFVFRLRAGVYSDFVTNTTLMFLPEFGFGHNGRYTVTLGGNLPILGSNVLPPSFRLALTANLLPKGAH